MHTSIGCRSVVPSIEVGNDETSSSVDGGHSFCGFRLRSHCRHRLRSSEYKSEPCRPIPPASAIASTRASSTPLPRATSPWSNNLSIRAPIYIVRWIQRVRVGSLSSLDESDVIRWPLDFPSPSFFHAFLKHKIKRNFGNNIFFNFVMGVDVCFLEWLWHVSDLFVDSLFGCRGLAVILSCCRSSEPAAPCSNPLKLRNREVFG